MAVIFCVPSIKDRTLITLFAFHFWNLIKVLFMSSQFLPFKLLTFAYLVTPSQSKKAKSNHIFFRLFKSFITDFFGVIDL